MRRLSKSLLKQLTAGPALVIALVYALFGTLWITLSDSILASLVQDIDQLSLIQTYKGWLYVGITAVLVFVLVWVYFQRGARLSDRLRAREEAFSDYLQYLPVGAFRTALEDGRFIMANDALARMLGYESGEELLGHTAAEFYADGGDRGRLVEKLKAEGALYLEPRWLRRPDGTEFTGALSARLLEDEEGTPYLDGVLFDITAEREAQEGLRRLSLAVQQAEEWVLVTNPAGDILYANEAFKRFSETHREGENIALIWGGSAANDEVMGFAQALSSGESWRGRISLSDDGGARHEVACSLAPVRDDAGKLTHFVSVGRDVTKEAELEQELRQLHKMEAMGRMAGGIAHDFNNILSAIIGYADLALAELPPGSTAYADVGEILTAGRRARDIVSRILAFSRHTQPEFRPLKPADIVEEVLVLVRSALPSTIALEVNIDPECSAVMGDPTQLHQVVMNLVTNAHHAMDDTGGALRVGLHEVEDMPADLPPGKYVCLSVADAGVGIAPEALPLIFDPYFTTKNVGEGTGLGLATVQAIVRSCGGAVTVDSTPGKGTEFRIYLPATDAPVQAPEASVHPVPARGERVLLVDDELPVLNVTCRQLERLGYVVTTAERGDQALERFRADPESFSVIITDYTMPGMTGIELTHALRAVSANVPIVLATGHGNLMVRGQAVAAGVNRVLTKPLQAAELSRAVRDLILA